MIKRTRFGQQLFLAVAATTLLAGSPPANLQAALIAYEPFDYPAGSELMGLGGGSGWTSPWGIRPASFGPPPPGHYTVGGGSLAAPAGLPTHGNHGYFLGVPAFPSRELGRMFPDVVGAPDTTLWISFLGQRIGEATAPGTTGWPNNPYPRSANLSFFDVQPTLARRSERIGIGNSTTSNNPDPNHYDEWSLIPEGLPINRVGQADHMPRQSELAWAVVRIDFLGDATVPDNAWLWLNPDPRAGEPLKANADVTILNNHANALDYSGIDMARPFVGNGDTAPAGVRPPAEMLLDEIRIGTTWLDVNGGVPEPSSGALALCGWLAVWMWRRVRRRYRVPLLIC